MGRKKVWSIILLCIIVIYFVPMLLLCITMLDSAYDITTVGLAEAQLPGQNTLCISPSIRTTEHPTGLSIIWPLENRKVADPS